MRLPIQVECIIYRRIDSKIEYLVLKRIPEKGGFWQSPTGGFEDDDGSLLNACYREIYEETGINQNDILSVYENVYIFQFEDIYLDQNHIMTEYVFGFEVNPDVTITLDGNVYVEHEEYQWVSFKEALKLLKWQNNKDAFSKLNELLN